jgi:hypothetical protein
MNGNEKTALISDNDRYREIQAGVGAGKSLNYRANLLTHMAQITGAVTPTMLAQANRVAKAQRDLQDAKTVLQRERETLESMLA